MPTCKNFTVNQLFFFASSQKSSNYNNTADCNQSATVCLPPISGSLNGEKAANLESIETLWEKKKKSNEPMNRWPKKNCESNLPPHQGPERKDNLCCFLGEIAIQISAERSHTPPPPKVTSIDREILFVCVCECLNLTTTNQLKAAANQKKNKGQV